MYENTPALAPGVKAFQGRDDQAGRAGHVLAGHQRAGQRLLTARRSALSRSGATATWLYMAPTPAAKLANQADARATTRRGSPTRSRGAFDLVFTVAPTAFAAPRAFSPWLPLGRPAHEDVPGRRTATRRARTPTTSASSVGAWVRSSAPASRRLASRWGRTGSVPRCRPSSSSPTSGRRVSFGAGVREGANVVAVLKEEGGHWALDRDFTSGFYVALLLDRREMHHRAVQRARRTRSWPSAWC